MKVLALIDTGASTTCISTKVADGLHLRPVGTCQVGGAYGHPEERNLYSIDFAFEGSDFQFVEVQVSETDLHVSPYEMLVGRDVLAICHFTYDGYTGQFTLEVPSPASPNHPHHPNNKPAMSKNPAQGATTADRRKRKSKRDMVKESRKKNRS